MSEATSKYFGEGVQAALYTASRWAIKIRRESCVTFLDIDNLNRGVEHLLRCIREARKELELIQFGKYGSDTLAFSTAAEAFACLVEIQKAVRFIRETTFASEWRELRLDELVENVRTLATPLSGLAPDPPAA